MADPQERFAPAEPSDDPERRLTPWVTPGEDYPEGRYAEQRVNPDAPDTNTVIPTPETTPCTCRPGEDSICAGCVGLARKALRDLMQGRFVPCDWCGRPEREHPTETCNDFTPRTTPEDGLHAPNLGHPTNGADGESVRQPGPIVPSDEERQAARRAFAIKHKAAFARMDNPHTRPAVAQQGDDRDDPHDHPEQEESPLDTGGTHTNVPNGKPNDYIAPSPGADDAVSSRAATADRSHGDDSPLTQPGLDVFDHPREGETHADFAMRVRSDERDYALRVINRCADESQRLWAKLREGDMRQRFEAEYWRGSMNDLHIVADVIEKGDEYE